MGTLESRRRKRKDDSTTDVAQRRQRNSLFLSRSLPLVLHALSTLGPESRLEPQGGGVPPSLLWVIRVEDPTVSVTLTGTDTQDPREPMVLRFL